ncbi:hypothetical protein NDN08_005926 [Rhodosorus marinus]|uniref:Uncharacterized protein n=1 Tax=Rhodosorus marinus TaxID=101924 RepID=A0AAV8UPU5_9RHOD|nr:hypothetical protein NDN08_005926 [Rhodosorus marinus]
MFPGDSCETEFGTGLVAQRSDSIGCNCRINCTLSPCDGDPENCEDYTFGTCDLEDGERGIVVPTSVPGTCTCQRCDPGKCAHPDAGCIVEGKSCSNLNGLMDVFFTDDTTKCNCGCDLNIPDQAGRSASSGGVCLQGLARGVVVTGNEEGECGCQVQNCTSSSCEGPDCETFDGVLGETCDSDTGIVEILQDGSCKCQPICQTVNCDDEPEICTDPDGTPKVGDVCVLEFDSLGVLEASSDVAGECDCVAPTCVYTYQIRIGRNSIGTGFGNPGDACTTSEAPGVVSDECECEPLCDVECIPVGCQTDTGRCREEIPPVIVNGQCLTSSEVAGTYQLVSGSDQFCECVASR